jgi:hypothetical protein
MPEAEMGIMEVLATDPIRSMKTGYLTTEIYQTAEMATRDIINPTVSAQHRIVGKFIPRQTETGRTITARDNRAQQPLIRVMQTGFRKRRVQRQIQNRAVHGPMISLLTPGVPGTMAANIKVRRDRQTTALPYAPIPLREMEVNQEAVKDHMKARAELKEADGLPDKFPVR